jgi:CubicO group peptidase (beta-lactamase class C family)
MSSAIDQVLQDAVDAGAVPNVAAIVADRDGIVYEGAVGPRVVGGSDPVTADTEFRIMSMTKIIATTVALQQREQGTLDFDAPVANYCPAFAEVKVLEGFDGDTPRYREPARQPTVKHLLTHTSGLGYWFWNDQLVRWEAATGVPNVLPGSDEAFTAPLLYDPGTVFNYGISTDWLGKVVESVSGKTLDVLVKEGISGPLGMHSTTFRMSEAQQANATPVHVKGADGTWASAGEILNQSPDWWAGGHGLYSTPHDYIRFERALLRGGELDGRRILGPGTVDEAFSNQIGEIDFPAELPTADPTASDTLRVGPGYKWGFGLLLNTEDVPGARRAGSGAWAGLCNTHFWIDRSAGICASIYSNTLPFVTPEAFGLYNDFEKAVYASL